MGQIGNPLDSASVNPLRRAADTRAFSNPNPFWFLSSSVVSLVFFASSVPPAEASHLPVFFGE
jgi:hypothetical protein